jgi:sensor histidine kinase regulating citrate/malate metabolism
MAVMSGIVGSLVFLMKRELARLDKMQMLVESIASEVKIAAELRASLAAMNIDYIKFFGDRGERSTLWRRIDEIKEVQERMENNMRERDHYIANKMMVILGKMQVAKMIDNAEFNLPEYRS